MSNREPVLECVSKFNLKATVERFGTLKLIVTGAIQHVVLDGIASQIKAGGKREGFESETGSNSGIKAPTGYILVIARVIIDSPVIILPVITIVVVIKVSAEDEGGASGDVDKGFHRLAAIEVVTVVQEHRNAMTGTNIHGVAQTNTKQVLRAVEEDAVYKHALKSDIGLLSYALGTAAQIESVFIDHVVRNLLFLTLLSRHNKCDAQEKCGCQ